METSRCPQTTPGREKCSGGVDALNHETCREELANMLEMAEGAVPSRGAGCTACGAAAYHFHPVPNRSII